MLTYMATCRCTDKKPCDNIPEEPTISKLANNAIPNIFGGGITENALNELVGGTQAFKEASSFLNSPAVKAARRMDTVASAATKATRIAATNNTVSRVSAAFMVEPLGSGKALCPFAG